MTRLLVPQHEHRLHVLTCGIRIEVDIMQESQKKCAICSGAWILLVGSWEAPITVILWVGLDNGYAKHIVQTLGATV